MKKIFVLLTGLFIYFKITVGTGAVCQFSFSENAVNFKEAGPAFEAKPGRWPGAKIGYSALREVITNASLTVDIDWFRINKNNLK